MFQMKKQNLGKKDKQAETGSQIRAKVTDKREDRAELHSSNVQPSLLLKKMIPRLEKIVVA